MEHTGRKAWVNIIFGKVAKLGVLLAVLLSVYDISAQTDTGALKFSIRGTGSGEKSKSASNVDLQNPINSEWKYNPKTIVTKNLKTLGG